MTKRTRRGIAGSVLVVVALVFGAVIVTALRAEGRERSEANTNDGGAWLLKRDLGYVGHVNREVQEVTSAVSVAAAGADFDTDQATDVILVQDRTAGSVTLIDDSIQRKGNTLQVDAAATVHAVDGGALFINESSLSVWKLTRNELASFTSLDGEEPVLRGEGAGRAATFPDGHAVIADEAAGNVVFLRPDGSTERSPDVDLSDGIVSITALGSDRAVLADQDGDLFVATPDEVGRIESGVTGSGGEQLSLILQQPGDEADQVVAAAEDGRLFAIPLDAGREDGATGEPTPMSQMQGTSPVSPIAFGGCTFAVSTNPPSYLQQCGDETIDARPLEGAGAELRLRLVNGWIWINDVDSGAAWVTEPERRLDQVDDWGAVLSDLADDSDDSNDEPQPGDEVETVVDPDDPTAEIIESDVIDEDGPNQPPIARDDEAATRVDRPVEVDVLANDNDPNGDVLIVTSSEQTGGDAIVSITPDGRGVHVAPAAGFEGLVTFAYTITDGRGESATATASVQVTASNGDDNQPPEPTADIASTRRGRPTTFDVLANDTDPDGDALVLESVDLADADNTAGVIVANPSGQVVFTPDPNTQTDRIELTYVVSDDFGATAEGDVVVDVRLEDANNEPDARNDAGVTTVGKPVRLDVINNDTDPDNDTLFASAQPTLVRPTDQSIDALDVNLTPDGEFFFNPATAGTFVFNYSVSDGEETDVAQIRVDVSERVENRPPVAVRDDVVIPAGGTRLIYVLNNDGDPDGDIVGIVGNTTDDGLTVKEVDGVGFLVTVAADAPRRPTFRYSISDGRWPEPVTANVVVAVTGSDIVDQPPVARDDVVEVRAGGKVAVPVLENDYDPEGGVLEVTGATTVDGVEAVPGLNGQSLVVTVGPEVVSSFTLSYTITDEAGNQSNAFVEVRIVPADEVSRPPIARTDLARTRSGVPVSIDVRANDTDPDGDLIVVEAISAQPAGGTATVTDGVIVYTPTDVFSGTDRLSYAVVDTSGDTAIGEVLVGVMALAGENRAPEAFDDQVEVIAGSAPIVLDVLANDSDPDSDRLLVTRVGEPTSGGAEVDQDNAAVVYTPPATTTTADGSATEVAFPYAIDDGRGGTAEATIRVTVRTATEPVAPEAVDDLRGPLITGESIDVDLLANDIDPDGNPAELVVTSDDPALQDISAGVVTFTAGATSGRHRYTITDGDGLSSTAELSVLVVPNRAPTVAPITAETAADDVLSIDVFTQGEIRDPDGDELFPACCDATVGGTATAEVSGPGELVVQFDPDDEFAGTASFSYSVDDQQGHTVSGSVAITVIAPENRPPTVAPGTFEIEAGTATTVDLTALVTDPDVDEELTFTVDGQSSDLVELSLDGSTVVATTATDQTGATSSFDFTVTDRAGESANGSVELTVTAPSAPPPDAQGDEVTTTQGEPVTVDVLANDVDPLAQGLTVASVAPSPEGTATITGGQITFAPNESFFGPTTFNYTIRDAADTPERESTAQVAVVVIGRPSAPGAPVAVPGNGTAVVNWSAPPANGAGIDNYEVRIGEGPGRAVGNVTGFTFDGLTNGEAVQFSVRAENSAGWGDWSAPSPAVVPDVEPGRPAAPSVQFADRALLVSWAPPANEGSAILNYDIRIGGGRSQVQRIGNVSDFRWDGLENGVEYTFDVRAVNAKGEGDWSTQSASEHPLTAPSAPGTPAGQRGDGYIDVAWQPGGNGGDAITQYEVQIVSSGATASTTGTTFRWANLPNGEPQQFQVRALNRGGWGPFSSSSTPVTPCGNPTAPTNVQAQRGDTQATVTWAAADARGCAISNYQVTSSGGQSVSVGGGATTATVPGLANGTAYTFTVVATNEVGPSPVSGASNAVTPAGPPRATTITRATPDTGRVTVEWQRADDNGSAITTYQLSVNGGGWENVGTGTSTTRTGLANGTNYSFQMRAVNDVGTGPGGNTVSARTPGEPAQVGGLSVASGGRTQINSSWSRPNDNGKPIERYEVDIDPGGQVNESGTSHTFNGLQEDTNYRVRVRACNEVGCGSWSGWQSARTDPPPPPPPPPQRVTWSAYGNAQGQQGCNTAGCKYVRAEGTGFTPGRSYTVTCNGSRQGAFSSSSATANANGTIIDDPACWFGYTGETFWITINGVSSDRRPFPA